jgi:hypothetical protein
VAAQALANLGGLPYVGAYLSLAGLISLAGIAAIGAAAPE